MVALILRVFGALRSALRTRADLALENLALRQQLANLRRTSSRLRLRNSDRAFWLVLSRFWSRWADVLVVVKPDTVLRWHRAGFRLFWRWKSRSHGPAEGSVAPEVRRLIRQKAEANVGWGAPRIHGELLKLGIDIGERSVSRFMPPTPRKPPSQTWRTFLDNDVASLASIDFFTVPTATFRVLYVFFVLAHDRRRVLHFRVTEHPSAAWTPAAHGRGAAPARATAARARAVVRGARPAAAAVSGIGGTPEARVTACRMPSGARQC
jgi:putative transposase